jgi:hypothetical protein
MGVKMQQDQGVQALILLFLLCPNCARQGQKLPNKNKRNQKCISKFVIIQYVEN